MVEDEYTKNPGLTSLGKLQSEKSSAVFVENSVDEIWVSPLKRAQETFTPFKEKNIGRSTHTYDWLQEMHDEDEDRKSTRLNSSHSQQSRMPSSA